MPKRLFDLMLSIPLLLMSAPLILFLMAWIIFESPGPAVFKQARVGLNGKVFKMLKLRTMVADAAERGGFRTLDGDPRITRLGRVLRRASLDELPQLVNVLRGEMSMVGPRPDTPRQEDDYSPNDWQARHKVRPGITGPAQARLRSKATFEQRLALDLEYARSPTVIKDLGILTETAVTFLFRKGN